MSDSNNQASEKLAAWNSRYRELRVAGAIGWGADDSYERKQGQIRAALALRQWPAARRFLDVGCGGGNIAAWISGQGWKTTGIDLSPPAIDWARERFAAAAEFVVADIADLPDQFSDGTFDVVFDSDCFHMIVETADRQRAMAEARRVLKPAGLLLTSTQTPNLDYHPDRESNDTPLRFDPSTSRIYLEARPEYFLATEQGLVGELRAAGLRVIAVDRRPPISRQPFVANWIAVTAERD